jgi:hypothetical protein
MVSDRAIREAASWHRDCCRLSRINLEVPMLSETVLEELLRDTPMREYLVQGASVIGGCWPG